MARTSKKRGKPSEPDPAFVERLERAKAASVAQLLFKCARLLNEQALARLDQPPGAPRIRPAHTSVFPHLDLAGTRLTELARRLGISKQAVGQLVDELEQMQVLERVPDPSDGRAKLIRFAKHSGASLLDGLAHLGRFEDELGEEIGAQRMAALHDGLGALLAALEGRGPS
ncbi:Transcriptional regulator, MarR family protein [Enhygromyxa salina]|uniref:Transcriptional regulator, MarR family protein n=1 Tax=Enhygromyxa salina TaxID=215803 RepID=A0A0C1ZCM6_9BACT|nr:MarR family transcriptional regulator [Enhygromyxa salina]KIG15459.1 Transcriptional regulator, MarR family protein [Enhygromyxa salina]